MLRLVFFVLLVVVLFQIICIIGFETIVSTSVGTIAGLQKRIEIDGQQRVVTEFLGIPYGEDTSGQNRFRRPVPKVPFHETYKAYTISPTCMQLTISSTSAGTRRRICVGISQEI